jgi:hypothetical protein
MYCVNCSCVCAMLQNYNNFIFSECDQSINVINDFLKVFKISNGMGLLYMNVESDRVVYSTQTESSLTGKYMI